MFAMASSGLACFVKGLTGFAVESVLQVSEADVLDVGVVVNAVSGTFSAKTWWVNMT